MKNAISMKNHEFGKVYKTKNSIANNLLILYTLKSDLNGINKLGISASKQVGNSIVRHRSVRLIRESYRHLEDRIKLNNYIVIIARPGVKVSKEMDVEKALYNLLKRANLLDNNKDNNNENKIETNIEE